MGRCSCELEKKSFSRILEKLKVTHRLAKMQKIIIMKLKGGRNAVGLWLTLRHV